MKKQIILITLLIIINACTTTNPSVNETIQEETLEYLDFYALRPNNIVVLSSPEGEIYHTWNLSHLGSRISHPFILSGGRLVYSETDAGILGIMYPNQTKQYELNIPTHHDVKIYKDKFILPTRHTRENTSFDVPIIDQRITFIEPETGELITEFSLYDILSTQINLTERARITGEYFEARMDQPPGLPLNLFHLNGMYVLTKDYNEQFTKDRVLLSLRNINTVVLLDLETRELIWEFGFEKLDAQHYPVMTREGTMLLFDNGYLQRDYSRIIEIDIKTKEIIWEYQDLNPETYFYSNVMGSAQPLNNGNILILESTTARVFEINKQGNITWTTNFPENRIYRYERLDKNCINNLFKENIQNSLECLI